MKTKVKKIIRKMTSWAIRGPEEPGDYQQGVAHSERHYPVDMLSNMTKSQ